LDAGAEGFGGDGFSQATPAATTATITTADRFFLRPNRSVTEGSLEPRVPYHASING
jgi:hypothetical protein